MNDELFDELLEKRTRRGAILRGEKEPSRRFEFAAPNVKRIREAYWQEYLLQSWSNDEG